MGRVLVADSRPEDWIYVSEGGASIVFSYAGPTNPNFTGKVLRLRKIPLSDAAQSREIEEEEPDDPMIAFQYTIMASLVPSKYLPDLDVVLLDANWLETLETLRDADRPTERQNKDRIDKGRRKGILATDLVGGAHTLAVEIKPKWGFMPNPTHLSQDTAPLKTSTCRFCMHTLFKSKDGDITTKYCPLDLYSGDEARMRNAIHHLWSGWLQSNGALNNLRLFISGKMLKPSESLFALKEFLPGSGALEDAFAAALLPFLRSPLLETISNLQRTLDALDIEGLAKLHAIAHPDASGLDSVVWDPSFEEWQDFIASYGSDYCTWDHSKLCPEHIRAYLMAYLLSATFKDCSVIFRIQRPDASVQSSVDAPHAITIIDLDVKSMNRLGKWADLDRHIIQHCQALDATQRKPCVEEHSHVQSFASDER
ncbi:inositol-pentakisphosphate 2-kinase [Melanogaster broomeanus]|nr:inositol-pentakisphosphate 2-kinase [Melanogaster broomeanus]